MQLGEVYLNINTCFVLFLQVGSQRLTFESQTQYVAEDGLKLILLPQPPESWGYPVSYHSRFMFVYVET